MEIGISLNFDMFYLMHILHAFLIASQRQWSKLIGNENCINVRIPNSVFGFPFSRHPRREMEAPFQEQIMEVCVLIYSIHFAEGLLIRSLQTKARVTISPSLKAQATRREPQGSQILWQVSGFDSQEPQTSHNACFQSMCSRRQHHSASPKSHKAWGLPRYLCERGSM